MKIRMKSGHYVIIDDDDSWVNQFKWHLERHGEKKYAQASVTRIDGTKTTVKMHRLILSAKPGQWVDHRNNDGLDNRRCNIRICTPSQNHMARHNKKRASFHKRDKVWAAGITKDGQRHHIGNFKTKEDAIAAYDNASIKMFGEFHIPSGVK